MPHRFSLANVSALRLAVDSGAIALHAEDRDDLVVEGGGQSHPEATRENGYLTVFFRRPSAALIARCPQGLDVLIGTQSGNVHAAGQLGRVRVTTASGKVQIEHAAVVDVRSVTGRVSVESCDGECRIQAASGGVDVGRAGSAYVSTVSGAVSVREVSGDLHVQTVRGRVDVECGANVFVESMTGRVRVRVPRGLHPSLSLQSMADSRLTPCHRCDRQVTVKTVRGRIDVMTGE